jgi:hypothetical protein
MKTETFEWSSTYRVTPAPARVDARRFMKPAALWRLLAAGLVAAGLSLLGLWAIEAGAVGLLGASLWLAGLVLLAVALDTDSAMRALWLALSAVAVMAMAWLGLAIAPEFNVVGAWLLTGWIAMATARVDLPRSGR